MRVLVVSEALERGVPQLLVGGPSAVINVGDQIQVQPTLSGEGRQTLREGALLAPEGLKLAPKGRAISAVNPVPTRPA